MLSPREYADWWYYATDDDGELPSGLPEPVATLAAHVMALQERIDKLPGPDSESDDSWQTQCACAYDDPRDVCAVHQVR